jgi:hypothetical protein
LCTMVISIVRTGHPGGRKLGVDQAQLDQIDLAPKANARVTVEPNACSLLHSRTRASLPTGHHDQCSHPYIVILQTCLHRPRGELRWPNTTDFTPRSLSSRRSAKLGSRPNRERVRAATSHQERSGPNASMPSEQPIARRFPKGNLGNAGNPIEKSSTRLDRKKRLVTIRASMPIASRGNTRPCEPCERCHHVAPVIAPGQRLMGIAALVAGFAGWHMQDELKSADQ